MELLSMQSKDRQEKFELTLKELVKNQANGQVKKS